MRRLALTAVLGSLVLAACSDQQKQSPTEPESVSQPSFAISDLKCATNLWLSTQLALTPNIFPGGKGKTLLTSANEKLTDINTLCRKNQRTAISKAIFFDDWMFKKFQAKLLTTNTALGSDVLTLFINVLDGVGINTSSVTPDLVTSDAGTGVFECEPTCPTTPTTVITTFSLAALQIPVGGFSETTLLILDKLPNSTRLKIPPGQARSQFAPFYNMDALNASNRHVLNSGKYAHVEMCLYATIEYPPGYAIGHNPVFGAPGYPFEVLPPDDGNLLLSQTCQTPPSLSSVDDGSWRRLALSAWHTTKHAVATVLLPEALDAATIAVGGSGSASGKTSSLSPFGIVGPAILDFAPDGNPGSQTFVQNVTLTWDSCNDGCDAFPTVKLTDADGIGIGGVPITVSLVPLNGSTGTFTTGEGGSTLTVTTSSGEGAGFAQFNNLSITEPGTYALRFTAPDKVSPLTSTAFTVAAPPLSLSDPIGAGGLHSCAIKNDGTVSCWGNNQYGQSSVPAGLAGVVAVDLGTSHTCALKSDGTLTCWGRNSEAQAAVPAGLVGVTAVSAGGFHTCALKTNGTVTCWGLNDLGQTTVPAGLTDVIDVSGGAYHTCALKNDGTVSCWGYGGDGQTTVPAGLTSGESVDAGELHTCVLKSDGTIICWGSNNFGQAAVPAGLVGVTAVSAGGFHTCALKSDGTVTCWGLNELGQTTAPEGLAGVAAVSAGGEHTCAYKSDGTVTCWGSDAYGESTVPGEFSPGPLVLQ